MSASNMLSAQQQQQQQQQYNYNMSSGPQSMGGQGMYQWSGQGGKCKVCTAAVAHSSQVLCALCSRA